jgi:ornithine cyclodeaminase/alanine dehydrogenase-like protein (mu-crystallin family)
MTAIGLRRLRHWDRIVATDLDPARAAALTEPVRPEPVNPVPAEPVLAEPPEPVPAQVVLADARAVAAVADVVVLATWSREPLLDLSDVRNGQRLTTLGADEPGKAELSRAVLAASRVLTDDVGLAAESGAFPNAGLGPEAPAGTLGQVLRGEIPAHPPGGQPSVYAPVGLPGQDLALTWSVYQAVRAAGTGQESDLLA